MLSSSRGLGGSIPGEDLLRSARALNKGLREADVPPEIIETVSNLDSFIKEQQIIQAKVSALCQTSASVEECTEYSKIQHLVELAPEGKDILEKTAVALESINRALREMQVSVNLVWQKAQVAGLPLVSGSSVPVHLGRGAGGVGAPKLTSYFETEMRRLEEQILQQQRRIDELMSAVSTSQDPCTIAHTLPEVIHNINQSIISLAANLSERHEQVVQMKQAVFGGGRGDVDETGLSALQRYSNASKNASGVGINVFNLAAEQSQPSPLRQSFNQTTTTTTRPSGFLGGLLTANPTPSLNTTASGLRLPFGSSNTTTFGAPTPQVSQVRPFSSDTTNNRFSTSFAAPAGLDPLGIGKRSRAL